MSSNFEKAFIEIIGIEGGYVNHPHDKGGPTKYGISQKSYPHLDIKRITLEEAKNIYYKDYWNHRYLRLDNILEYRVALEIFDTSVNMGPKQAAYILQKSLNILNRNEKDFEDLEVDGWIGEQTLMAYDKVDKFILLKVLNGYQFIRYVNIAENNPTQEEFFNGWMKRV